VTDIASDECERCVVDVLGFIDVTVFEIIPVQLKVFQADPNYL